MKSNLGHFVLSSLVFVFLWVLGVSCSSADESSHQEPPQPSRGVTASRSPVDVPSEFREGAQQFHSFCSRCHGAQGVGTDQGPPLVHKIYEPSHHGDHAFFRAAAQGVRAHHWKFGNMPNIPEVSERDVQEIVNYIRWLQRQAGIN